MAMMTEKEHDALLQEGSGGASLTAEEKTEGFLLRSCYRSLGGRSTGWCIQPRKKENTYFPYSLPQLRLLPPDPS